MSHATIVELIRKKRDSKILDREEISLIVNSATNGTIDDAQLGAFLMASFINGLDESEGKHLTDLMRLSGKTLDLSMIEGPKADKHSTGGVGDKTSMIVAPVVAACGAVVPMITGRGLGHTGGTSDKLESIPGFRTEINIDEFTDILKKTRVAMICQSSDIAPADKKIYSVRDVTSTVESIPLITASIMSKKLAEDLDSLVLDVKVGSGAFMKSLESAKELSHSLIRTGKHFGVKVSALITSMDQPLGTMVGNSLEIEECVQILKNETISETSIDLKELSLELAAEMVFLSGLSASLQDALILVNRVIENGKAFEKFLEMTEAQGGENKALEKTSNLPKAAFITDFKAEANGFISAFECCEIGYAASELGGGRFKSTDKIDHGVGIEFLKKLGGFVEKGEIIAKIHHSGDPNRLERALERIKSGMFFSEAEPKPINLIISREKED